MLTTAAPHGTVTFLFTDMEGSTRLWDEHPTAMNDVLARHDAILDDAARTHGGYVFSRAGDGWGIAFASAVEAIRAALDIQRDVSEQEWPDPIDGIRIRMGLHAGTANERDGDYFGTAVNRAARVSAAAAGGQVFITDAVRGLIADHTDASWELHDLGDHRLRDLTRLEHLWQLTDATKGPSGVVSGPRAIRGNLPKPGATIVGRDRDVEEVVALARTSRVVTLAGVGGVGKTTLGIEVARTIAPDVAGGAWFVDLAVVGDPDDLPATILSAIGAKERLGMSVTDSLVEALAVDARVIVLDNAEHLIDAVAPLVEAIAAGTTSSTVIVTSREPLAIDFETIHRVAPLDVGAAEGGSPAASLFVERALANAPDLDRTDFQDAVVTEICRRLDGLPLAIELAAAHAEVMTPTEILRALEADRLSLESASRSASTRHRSLDDLVAWSYDRLDPAARSVFERTSLFVGGCTRDAAVSVCGDDALDEATVRSALRTLVRKSMLTTDRSDGETRFSMLETLRTVAAHRLAAGPDLDVARDRHARWFAVFSEDAAAAAMSPDEGTWLRRIMREVGNLERAAAWACEHRAFDVLGSVGSCLPVVLESRVPPGVDPWMDAALDALPDDHPARVDYAMAKAYVTMFRGDIEGCVDAFDDAARAVAELPQGRLVRESFRLIAAFFSGDLPTVIEDSPSAIATAVEVGDLRMAGSLGCDLGLALLYTGDSGAAWRVAEDLREPMEASGIPSVLGWYRYLLGELTAETDPDTALDYLEEAVEYGVETENDFLVGIALIALASTAGRNDQSATALDAMGRAVSVWYGIGNRPQFWTAIRNLVEILHRTGRDADAVMFHAAVEADADHAPQVFGPYGDLYRRVVSEATEALDPHDLRAATSAGAAMSYADVATRSKTVIEEVTDERRRS